MKRIVLSYLLLAAGMAAAAQTGGRFTLTGFLTAYKSGKVYLTIYDGDKTRRDTASLQQGRFTIRGNISSPSMAILSMPSKKDDWLRFYMEPGTMHISGRGNPLKDLVVSGSETNDADRKLAALMKAIEDWETRHYAAYIKAVAEKKRRVLDSLEGQDEAILHEKRRVVKEFVLKNPGSVRGAMAVEEQFSYYAEAEDVAPLYLAFTEAVKQSQAGMAVKKMLDVYKTIALGRIAPDIKQAAPDGREISLSSLRGKYVLVDFWASWCSPCRKENPNLVKVYEKYKNRGFEILGVSYDNKKDRWEAAIAKDSLTWPQVSDLKGWSNATASVYYIKAIPANLLIDPEGRIIAKNLMGRELYGRLAQLFP